MSIVIITGSSGLIGSEAVNFFSNSFNSYADKFLEAKFSKPLYETDNEYLNDSALLLSKNNQ